MPGVPSLVLLIMGGSSIGLVSMQAAACKRTRDKANANLMQKVNDEITSPTEWSQAEDVYCLRSTFIEKSQSLEQKPSQSSLSNLRQLMHEKYTKLRTKQTLFIQSLLPQKSETCNDAISSVNSDAEQTPRNMWKRLFGYCSTVCNERNKEQQLQKIKEQIIATHVNKVQQDGNSATNQQLLISRQHAILQSLLSEQQNNPLHEQSSISFRNALLNYPKVFTEKTVTSAKQQQAIVYTEYEGDQPTQALLSFMDKFKNHLNIQKAVVVHYICGKGNQTSFIIGLEYNPIEEDINEGLMYDTNARKGLLKKTDSFSFECIEERPLPLDEWLNHNQKHQEVLMTLIEQDLESKMTIGGVRQMKYVESFSVDSKSQALVKYAVQVPFGSSEQNYDSLRSKKSVSSDVHFHDSFKQFDRK